MLGEYIVEKIDGLCIWVKLTVFIRNNKTNEIREHSHLALLDKDLSCNLDLYLWEEGNFSCDCNRRLFFYPGQEFEDDPCGDEEFSVNIINPKTGLVIYKEF